MIVGVAGSGAVGVGGISFEEAQAENPTKRNMDIMVRMA
jgi:hypothetical protein